MRCECCNNVMTPAESTSKFVESDTYTNTCFKCLAFLPPDVAVRTRSDFDDADEDDFFDYESGDYDDE